MLLGSARIVSDDRGALKSHMSRPHPKKCRGALGFRGLGSDPYVLWTSP
jgi:hypothetical protein